MVTRRIPAPAIVPDDDEAFLDDPDFLARFGLMPDSRVEYLINELSDQALRSAA